MKIPLNPPLPKGEIAWREPLISYEGDNGFPEAGFPPFNKGGQGGFKPAQQDALFKI